MSFQLPKRKKEGKERKNEKSLIKIYKFNTED